MSLPGLVTAGTPSPTWLRIINWGLWKSGKTVFSATFPRPLFIHPAVESGYDALKIAWNGVQWVNPFDVVAVGAEPWNRSVRHELDEWIAWLQQDCATAAWEGRAPTYQTVVFGGFSVTQKAVLGEFETLLPGEKGVMRRYGRLASWAQAFTQQLLGLPVHIIIELSAKEIRPENEKVGSRRVEYEPELVGQGKSVLFHDANVIVFQEAKPGRYLTHFTRTGSARHVDVRLLQLRGLGAVENATYDLFAERLGLPPIWVADPAHPRCQPGQWPWQGHWHV